MPFNCFFFNITCSGTGKTLVARALANECRKGANRVAFFMRKGADCLSKWVGESERQLRSASFFLKASEFLYFQTAIRSGLFDASLYNFLRRDWWPRARSLFQTGSDPREHCQYSPCTHGWIGQQRRGIFAFLLHSNETIARSVNSVNWSLSWSNWIFPKNINRFCEQHW